MIIFYKKDNGSIIGTTLGRIHKQDLNIWIGNKNEIARIIVDWKPIKDYKNEKGEVIAQDFEPDNIQKDLFILLDKQPNEVYKYRVDLDTKQLVKI